jgi:hypothetical protein
VASERIVTALEAVLRAGHVTPDLAAGRDDVEVLGTASFAEDVIGAIAKQE